jgi:hypothetical protein
MGRSQYGVVPILLLLHEVEEEEECFGILGKLETH